MENLKDLVKGKVRFVHYRKGHLYYETDSGFRFPVPIDDCGDATFAAEDKGLLFMRYIRKALEDQNEKTEQTGWTVTEAIGTGVVMGLGKKDAATD